MTRIQLNTLENSIRRPIQNLRKHFSPSWFIDYKSCPKAFYFKHVAGIKLPEKVVHLVFGDAFHQAVEVLLSEKGTLEQAQITFKRAFDKNKIYPEEIDDYERLLPIGILMIDKFLEEIPLLDLSYGIKNGFSEKWIEAKLQDPFSKEELPLITKGKIDRLTETENVIEFKTSGGKWNPNEVKFKWQTIFYGWMYYQNKGRHPNKIAYVIVTKQKNPQVQIIEANYTLDDYSKLFSECKNIINKIELGIYDKPEDWHPPFCDCHKYEEILTT